MKEGGRHMKRWLKGAAALLLCVVLTLALAALPAQGSTVYFMAVNDVPLELSPSAMPVVSRGVLYVPYTVFSTNFTGVNLGVYAVYNSSQGRALVYSGRRQLTFDLLENETYDMDGNTYSERAMRRGSVVYLPLDRVCSMFGDVIRYTRCGTPYGMLVRVKNSAVVLSDEAFVDAAATRMRDSLDRYLKSQSSAAPTPSPTPASPPTPSESPEPTGGGARVYLAFLSDGEDGDGTAGLDQVLEGLSAQDCRGLFFLTPEELARYDDLVRRLVGSGHLVGARVSADTPRQALEELDRAGKSLADAARCRLCAVLAEGLDQEGLEQLEQAGYACWRTTTDGRTLSGSGAARTASLLRRLAAGRSARNYLLLDAGAGSTLRTVLTGLTQSDFQLRPPLPTEF